MYCLFSKCFFYLMAKSFRLDHIQERVESVLPFSSSNLEQIATWQRVLHTQSSKKVQEYLNTNLEQIAKVE